MNKETVYRNTLFKQLYFSRALSCAELSTKVDKSIPTVTAHLNKMVEEGLVFETGFAPSTGGRRPLMYKLEPNSRYVVAIAMDQFVTSMSVLNMKNERVADSQKIQIELENNPDALSQLIEGIDRFIDGSGVDKSKIVGVGIGMPGFVDVKNGLNYSFLESRSGSSITEKISEKLQLPVYINNDSSIIALAERRFGAAVNSDNAMVINIGWGVGLGMILKGELFGGHNGFAGELSHIPIFANNKLCKCGKIGCLETESSLLWLVEEAKAKISNGRLSSIRQADLNQSSPEIALGAIIAALEKGDTLAVELFSEAGYNIGRGIAILIHLLNPEIVILSGRGSLAGNVWQAPIKQALTEHCIPRLSAGTSVQISTLGYDAETIGAAALVMDNFET